MSSLATDDTIARLDGLTDVSMSASVDGSLMGYVASAGTWQVLANITAPSGVLTTTNAAHIGGIVFHSGGVVSEGTGTPGNARGANATDLQSTRASASQVASGAQATIGGGINNTASGNQSVCTGNGNQATGTFSQVTGGSSAIASLFGQQSQASGGFGTGGDCQTSVLTMRNSTTDGTTAVELFLNGSSSRLTLAAGRAFLYRIMVLGRDTTSGSTTCQAFTAVGVLARGTGNVAISGNTVTTVIATGTGACTVAADTTNQSLQILVTGIAAKTYHWECRIELVEIA